MVVVPAYAVDVTPYGDLPNVSRAAVSPGGGKVALVRPFQGEEAVFIYDMSGSGAKPKVIRAGGKPLINGIRWASDKVLLMGVTIAVESVSGGERRVFTRGRLIAITVDSGKAKVLMEKQAGVAPLYGLGNVVSVLPDDPKNILVMGYRWDKTTGREHTKIKTELETEMALFRVSLKKGIGKLVYGSNPQTMDMVIDGSGNVTARTELDPIVRQFSVWTKNPKWEKISTLENTELIPLSLMGISAKDGALLASGYVGGFDRVFALDQTSGAWGSPIHPAEGFDSGETILDPYTGKVVGIAWEDDYERQWFFDPELQSWLKELRDANPGENVQIQNWSRDRKKFTILVEGPKNPGTFYFFDAEKFTLPGLGMKYPTIQPEQIAPTHRISYPAADGMKIPAYLTLPPGKAETDGPFPMVVFPHGGPEARDNAGFDWWAQAMAVQGYAVLQPNFRGSSGYGSTFRNAGYGEFGGKMVDDVIAGARAMIANGTADSSNICIMGASYGGFSALAAGARAPDLFKCVISLNGVSDAKVMFADDLAAYGRNSYAIRYWEKYMGDRFQDREYMLEQSPFRHPERFAAPVLLIHSVQDSTVPIKQSEMMARVLRSAGKPVKLVKIDGDDHYMRTADTRHQVLQEIQSFIAENFAK
jgi:acetyl esterase/lipase